MKAIFLLTALLSSSYVAGFSHHHMFSQHPGRFNRVPGHFGHRQNQFQNRRAHRRLSEHDGKHRFADHVPTIIQLDRDHKFEEDPTGYDLKIFAGHHPRFRAKASRFALDRELADNGVDQYLIIKETVPTLDQQTHLHPSQRADVRGAFFQRLLLPETVDVSGIQGTHKTFNSGELITVRIPKNPRNRHHNPQPSAEQYNQRNSKGSAQQRQGSSTKQENENRRASKDTTRGAESSRANKSRRDARRPGQQQSAPPSSHAHSRSHHHLRQPTAPPNTKSTGLPSSSNMAAESEPVYLDDEVEISDYDDTADEDNGASFGSIFSGFWDNRGEYHFWGDAETMR